MREENASWQIWRMPNTENASWQPWLLSNMENYEASKRMKGNRKGLGRNAWVTSDRKIILFLAIKDQSKKGINKKLYSAHGSLS